MCVSFVNEGKTQVNWAITVGRKARKWVNANNTPPKGPPCHVLDLDEMTVKSLCLETFEKYNEDGHA
jgi:hypothetical protein